MKKKIDGAIISTYGNDLLEQWYLNLVEKSNTNLSIFRYYGEYKELNDYLLYNEYSILLVNWAHIHKFIEEDCIKNKFLVIDEVHGFGSKTIREQLTNKMGVINYRLGLSATSERNYDDEGNEFITSELGEIIYKYDVSDAIKNGILCEFDYIPLRYELSDDDKQELQNAYSRHYARSKQGIDDFESKKTIVYGFSYC